MSLPNSSFPSFVSFLVIEEKTSGESKGVIQLTVSLSFPRALFLMFPVLPLLPLRIIPWPTVCPSGNRRNRKGTTGKSTESQWKVDRELANHSLSSTASQGTSNIPFPWFLMLGANSQAQDE